MTFWLRLDLLSFPFSRQVIMGKREYSEEIFSCCTAEYLLAVYTNPLPPPLTPPHPESHILSYLAHPPFVARRHPVTILFTDFCLSQQFE